MCTHRSPFQELCTKVHNPIFYFHLIIAATQQCWGWNVLAVLAVKDPQLSWLEYNLYPMNVRSFSWEIFFLQNLTTNYNSWDYGSFPFTDFHWRIIRNDVYPSCNWRESVQFQLSSKSAYHIYITVITVDSVSIICTSVCQCVLRVDINNWLFGVRWRLTDLLRNMITIKPLGGGATASDKER